MLDFFSLAAQRRSIRKYQEKPLDPATVVALTKGTLLAPSSKNKRPCRLVLVDDPQLLYQLSQCKPMGGQMIAQAPLAVVVTADTTLSDVWIEDASAMTTFLLLQAEDLGLGACWVQVRGRTQEDGTPSEDFVRDILGLPPHMAVLCIVPVGYKAKPLPAYTEEQIPLQHLSFNQYISQDQDVCE